MRRPVRQLGPGATQGGGFESAFPGSFSHRGWRDKLALDAASAAAPEEFDGRFPGMTLASFFPSLHLNLAADYEKLGDFALAREHAVLAAEAVPALDDSGLGNMTSGAIERLLSRLADPPHGRETD